jgi:hypothetical protein
MFRDPPRRFAHSRNMKEWMSLAQQNTPRFEGGSPRQCMIRQSVSGLAKATIGPLCVMTQIQAPAAGFNRIDGGYLARY